jgi:uncharacterized protein YgbK (DUF1537 family)
MPGNGVPLNDTEFASDPKTPVPRADIGDLFGESHATVVTVDTLTSVLAQALNCWLWMRRG